MNTTSVEVTAGLGGFLVLFALAVAVWFLGRDLTRRLRRMNRAEEMRQPAAASVADVRRPGSAAGEVSGVSGAGEDAVVEVADGPDAADDGSDAAHDGPDGSVPPRTDA